MLFIRNRAAPQGRFDAKIVLPFDMRQKSRLRTQLESGEEVAMVLARGTILRGGDYLAGDDGRVVLVEAAAERVLRVECDSIRDLARVAYHLGNRHVPLQIGQGWLRLLHDEVLKDMILGLNARAIEEMAAFEPEAGAYGAADRHGDEGSHEHEPK